MPSAQKPSSRLAYLDWTRGLAAVIMLQGHVFHSFAKPELRQEAPFVLSQFVGGMPPAIFLFLTGVTLAFLMESRERIGVTAGLRVLTALRRAGYLIGLAFLFRLQLFLFGLPQTNWMDLFRVDILNSMGFALAVLSTMAIFRTAERVRVCAIAGLGIAALSPLVSQLNWNGVPPTLKAYLAPDSLSFGFFPWAAFVAFGMSAGSILRLARRDQMDRVMQWAALAGFGLILGGRYFSDIPYSLYPKSDFWLDSPMLVFIKLGVIFLMLAGAYLWTTHGAGQRWSWVRQFGTTSLLVYWVHTELVYGRWLWFWKESLSNTQAALAAAGVVALMLFLSVIRTNWKNWRVAGFSLAYPFLDLEPRRASGD